ncbi:MAG: hypothetical protein WA418_03095 [Bradyrhizobium sp.]
MKKLVYAIAAMACLIGAPVLISPADAQVSVDVGRDGPRLRLGSDNDRGMHRGEVRGRHRGEERGRHEGFRNQADCREITVRKRLPDGSMSVRTTRRCN